MIKRFLLSAAFISSSILASGQTMDYSRSPIYRQVFVETDDFDSAYPRNLERECRQPLPDTVLLAMGNGPAYDGYKKETFTLNRLL